MSRFRHVLRFFLWLFVVAIFIADFVKILLDLSSVSGSVHQRFLAAFFHSSFFLFELIMGGLIAYFMVKRPNSRLRLLSLAVFHYATVLVLPLAFGDFTWMAVLYPWPQTLLAFDPKTTVLVSTLSLAVGFLVVPVLTFRWGAKGFCGYVCPHGAFYSEAFGRLFSPPAGRLRALKKYFPPVYFLAMSAALVLILAVPSSLDPVRNTQKLLFFLTSQFFYLVIGVPLVGPRSYCTHFCPVGFEIAWLIRLSMYVRRKPPVR